MPDALVLVLANQVRQLAGCGFGVGQSVLLAELDVRCPAGFDLEMVEGTLQEFVNEPLPWQPAAADCSPEQHLAERILVWHGQLQQEAKLPVFGSGKVLATGASGADGIQRLALAMPARSQVSSRLTLDFLLSAIVSLAAAEGPEAVLPGVRQHFQRLQTGMAPFAVRGTNSIHFLAASHELGIERHEVVDHVWSYGQGRRRVLMESSITGATPWLGVLHARDKIKAAQRLRAAGLPVAAHAVAANADVAVQIADRLGYPVVVKPVDLDGGVGVTAGIMDEADLRRSWAAAAKHSRRVMVEKHHDGADYRITVLHGKAIKLLVRRPAGVIGNGSSTVAELVDHYNDALRRDRARQLKKRPALVFDDDARLMLTRQGLAETSVPETGRLVAFGRRANISAGGTYDVLSPAAAHPDNCLLAVNATLALGLDFAGIDILSEDPAVSWRTSGGIICEVNAKPQVGLRDSETIFGDILTTVLEGDGRIPLHLVVLPAATAAVRDPVEIAKAHGCNAVAWGRMGWVAEAGLLGPFPNVFSAAKGILLDSRVQSALVFMNEVEILSQGLPARHFASIRIPADAAWRPAAGLITMIRDHTARMCRWSSTAQP